MCAARTGPRPRQSLGTAGHKSVSGDHRFACYRAVVGAILVGPRPVDEWLQERQRDTHAGTQGPLCPFFGRRPAFFLGVSGHRKVGFMSAHPGCLACMPLQRAGYKTYFGCEISCPRSGVVAQPSFLPPDLLKRAHRRIHNASQGTML